MCDLNTDMKVGRLVLLVPLTLHVCLFVFVVTPDKYGLIRETANGKTRENAKEEKESCRLHKALRCDGGARRLA